MSERWHKESYVAEQEQLSSSINSMRGDVESSKVVTSKVVTSDLDLYISPLGNDETGNGTETKPFFSLNRCVEYINSRIMSIADGGRAYIRCEAGVYDYSAEEQNVRCFKPGLRLVIRGAQFNDVTDIYNQLLTKINNSEDPVYTCTGDGVVTTDVDNIVRVQHIEGDVIHSTALSPLEGCEVHAGDTIYPQDSSSFSSTPASIVFTSKRTEFQVGENSLWFTKRTTDCSLFNLRITNNSEGGNVICLQEIFCNEFKNCEIYSYGWGGVQIGESKISQMRDNVIVYKGSQSAVGLSIFRRSDVTLMQTNTIDGFDTGIAVSDFSLLKSQPLPYKYTTIKNCTTGLEVGSLSKAEVRPNNGPAGSGVVFENCTTDMIPSTTGSWSQRMGYIS